MNETALAGFARRSWPLAMRAVAAALAVLTAGCALKTPPPRSELLREAYGHAAQPATWAAQGAAAGPPGDGWLASFDDAQLSAHVAEALAHNADLRVAAARVEQASAYVRAAGGKLYPAVDLFANSSAKDASGLRVIAVMASLELDVWGRLRHGLRAAEEQYASASADHAYARQSLAALVAKASFLATEAHLQRELAAQSLASAGQLIDLAGERHRVGVGNELDIALARAHRETLRDGARQMALAHAQSLRALELLLGRYPAGRAESAPPRFPEMPPSVPAGLPSDLLERRPDVVAAERRVAAAFHRVEEAKAARLPAISLTAGLNRISSDTFLLRDRDNPAWSAGARLMAPLFHGGTLQAQADIRTAEQKEAIAAYARTGLQAFGEVESALASEFALHERQAILERSVMDNQRALELEQARYRVGSRDLRSVIQQQLAFDAARATLLRVQGEQRVQRVNVHLALGGDFEHGATHADRHKVP